MNELYQKYGVLKFCAGYYGAVYKALYTHSDSDKQAEVAVKTLQGRWLEILSEVLAYTICLIEWVLQCLVWIYLTTEVNPISSSVIVCGFLALASRWATPNKTHTAFFVVATSCTPFYYFPAFWMFPLLIFEKICAICCMFFIFCLNMFSHCWQLDGFIR